jgi:hypothetical protein
MTRVFDVVAGAFLSIAGATTVCTEAQAPLIVAYITQDNELVPVARYDGMNWPNTWPEPIEHHAPLPVHSLETIPNAWLGQPVPRTWTTWSPSTGQQRRVRVTGVDRDGSCVEAITLATSPNPQLELDGVAFNRPTTVNAILQLEQKSPEWDSLHRDVASLFRRAIANTGEQGVTTTKVLALARAGNVADETVVIRSVFRDPRMPVFFIEAQRAFAGIQSDIEPDALSYSGWFRRDHAGALIPIEASVGVFSTAADKLPRYEPIGILRLDKRSIWAMSEFQIESQTIVLFDVSAEGLRRLTSALISGC